MIRNKKSKSNKSSKLGLIGVGFVGGVIKKYFESQGRQVFLYDKGKHLGSPEQVNKADIVFIATPTPFHPNKGFDISAVEDAIKLLDRSKIVVIKSSMVPGTTESLQKKYPQHKILVCPEFLREAQAYNDFVRPDKQIIGYTKKSKNIAKKILSLLPQAPYKKIMPAREAEMVKYMANIFLALKVTFANEIYELCQKLKINYNQVREAVSKDPRIGSSHLEVLHGGYRGYGGSCFPKDINALIELADKEKVNLKLLKSMREANRKLLKECGLSEDYFLLNEHKAYARKKRR
jgi:UDPglucose 6-dehydrogenase